MAAIHGQPQSFLFSSSHTHHQTLIPASSPSPARITEKMANAPPFVPHSSSPAFPVAPKCFFLSLAAARPPLPPPPVFHHILGFHQIRQICFLYQPLPLAPKMSNPLYAPISPCSPQIAGGMAAKLGGDGRMSTMAARVPCWEMNFGSGSKTRKGTWHWMTKEEAERRRRLGSLKVCQSSSSFFYPLSSPSSPAESRSVDSGASSSSMEFHKMNPHGETRTTVMIKNIPNKLSRELLVKLLDEHCVEENRKLRLSSDPAPPSEYDFIYLPIDFSTNCGLGYAFVNFTSPQAAWRFHRAMEKHRWGLFETRKIGHICYARIQGKDAMVANFWSSSFRCDSDEFLPATFTPARNGSPPLPPATVVGKRLPRFSPPAAAAEAEPEPEVEATEAAVPDSSFHSIPARQNPNESYL